ncbi:MAG: 50S ribosomal protein L23 [Acholeplasmatales bacterium]|jgi:large subunit ribosomal protein L23|nr:50S ribosomal protein L23 [Acholeplasmatales bacterium]
MIIKYYDKVFAPVITEKSTKLIQSSNTYTFKVDKGLNKIEIKKAIEEIFDVNVLRVNTMNVKPTFKRVGQHEGFTKGYKKAMVTIAEGQSIDAFTV